MDTFTEDQRKIYDQAYNRIKMISKVQLSFISYSKLFLPVEIECLHVGDLDYLVKHLDSIKEIDVDTYQFICRKYKHALNYIYSIYEMDHSPKSMSR